MGPIIVHPIRRGKRGRHTRYLTLAPAETNPATTVPGETKSPIEIALAFEVAEDRD